MAYNNVELVPAYGRDYKSKAAVMTDWNADKDFRIEDMRHSGYVNKQQVSSLKAAGITHLHFRYNRLTMVAVVKL
jgi:hypothetical protein